MTEIVSFAEILEAHHQKRNFERQFPISRFVVRPLSFVSGYLLLRVTRSPSAVAGAGLTVGLAACAGLAMLGRWTVWPGLVLLLFYDLLDASDGVVARAAKNVTYYGRYLDGVIGEIVEGLYFVALGAGLYLAGNAAAGLTLVGDRQGWRVLMLLAGAACMCGRLYSDRVAGGYYEYLQKVQPPAQPESVTGEIQSSGYRRNWGYLAYLNFGSFDFQMLALLLSAAAGIVDLHLYAYAAFYLMQSLLVTVFYLNRARRTLASG